MSSDAFDLPLLVWSQDDILAHRSGYHVLEDYLPGSRLVTRRADPPGGSALWQTRIARRFSFSRWCVAGSFELEKKIHRHVVGGFTGPIHYLWCDRDLAFLDLLTHFMRLPLVGTFHQCPEDLARVIRRPSALRQFAAIILMSETQRGYFLQHGVDPQRLHTVLHGVDVDCFQPVSLEPPPDFTVLSVGGTRRDYAQMRAVMQACASDKNIRFIVLAPEDRAHHFLDLSNVSYRSRVSDDELRHLYQTCAAFLHLPENATANNALLEAMACGAPVVSQQVGGVPEYVKADAAMLARFEDTATTVQQLRALAADRGMQSAMRHAARRQAMCHDWRRVAEVTTQIYRQLS
jgi:glycosyltransferase involved in cell wall biosynthesis